MFKVQAIFVLDYKKINIRKIFHLSAKLIDSDSDIDEVLMMQQSLMAKIKYYAKDCIVLDAIIKNINNNC